MSNEGDVGDRSSHAHDHEHFDGTKHSHRHEHGDHDHAHEHRERGDDLDTNEPRLVATTLVARSIA